MKVLFKEGEMVDSFKNRKWGGWVRVLLKSPFSVFNHTPFQKEPNENVVWVVPLEGIDQAGKHLFSKTIINLGGCDCTSPDLQTSTCLTPLKLRRWNWLKYEFQQQAERMFNSTAHVKKEIPAVLEFETFENVWLFMHGPCSIVLFILLTLLF